MKRIFFLFVARTYAHDHVAVHLDETAIAVPGESRVARYLGESFHGLVVEAEVENRIHHAGHRVPRPGTNRHEQGIAARAELLAHLFLDSRDRCSDIARER